MDIIVFKLMVNRDSTMVTNDLTFPAIINFHSQSQYWAMESKSCTFIFIQLDNAETQKQSNLKHNNRQLFWSSEQMQTWTIFPTATKTTNVQKRGK